MTCLMLIKKKCSHRAPLNCRPHTGARCFWGGFHQLKVYQYTPNPAQRYPVAGPTQGVFPAVPVRFGDRPARRQAPLHHWYPGSWCCRSRSLTGEMETPGSNLPVSSRMQTPRPAPNLHVKSASYPGLPQVPWELHWL